MKMRARYVAWVLPFFLSACLPFHRKQVVSAQLFAPPVANLPRPAPTHPDLPVAALTIPDIPLDTVDDMEEEDLPPARRHHPPRPPAQVAVTPPADESTGVSAIGTLSGGENSDIGRQTNNSIAATERELNEIGHNLNSQDQKTAAQIREYLKQAREALLSGDVDGARTLVAKAKVLLGELPR